MGVCTNARLHQKAGEVGAGDEFRVADIFQGAFVATVDTDLRQPLRHFLGAFTATATCLTQTLL